MPDLEGELTSSSVGCTSDDFPDSLFSTNCRAGVLSSPSLTTSSDLARNFSDDNNILASLLFKIYLSSEVGKLGERGSAIELLPRIERSVTNRMIGGYSF